MLYEPSHYPSAREQLAALMRQQLRVIGAMLRRETRIHFGETRLGYLWVVIEQGLHLVVYVIVFAYILKRHAPLGGSVPVFMLTGMIPYFLCLKLAVYLSTAVEDNKSLLSLPPIKPLDLVISRMILETTTYLLVAFLGFLCLFIVQTPEAMPNDLLTLASVLVTVIILGFGLGMFNAAIRLIFHNWTSIFSLVTGPLFLLSGIWFLPAEIPEPYRSYLLYNPLMHYIMWVRTAFYRNYAPDDLDRQYAVAWAIVAMVLGLAAFRVARRKLVAPA